MFLLWIIAALSAVASIVTSELVERTLHMRVPVIGEFAGFVFTQNPGVAFGLRFFGAWQILIILLALILVIWLAAKSVRTRWSAVAFGCIIGGAIANIIERLPDGLVTDYFQVGSFYIFNAADSFITVGVGLLLLHSLFHRQATT